MKGRAVMKMGATNKDGASKAALAGGAIGALGGASTPTLTTCTPDDKTFYCRLVRFVNTIKLFISIIAIVGVIAFLIWFAVPYIKEYRKNAKK